MVAGKPGLVLVKVGHGACGRRLGRKVRDTWRSRERNREWASHRPGTWTQRPYSRRIASHRAWKFYGYHGEPPPLAQEWQDSRASILAKYNL